VVLLSLINTSKNTDTKFRRPEKCGIREYGMSIGKLPFIDFPSVGSALNASHGGRISLPVAPAMYIYSQFRHISGVPAPEGVQGVSISKLHILDSILNELAQMRQSPRPSFDVQGDTPEKHLNSLLEHFQAQVRQSHTANAANPYHNAAPQAGTAVNLII
jgi:hypothetical protein